MRALLVGMLMIAVAGCGTIQVSMPVGVAAILWGNARADYGAAKAMITMACKNGRLSKEECDSAAAIDIKAQVYREAVERAFLDPTQPVDWAKVMDYSSTIIGMLLKLGVVP